MGHKSAPTRKLQIGTFGLAGILSLSVPMSMMIMASCYSDIWSCHVLIVGCPVNAAFAGSDTTIQIVTSGPCNEITFLTVADNATVEGADTTTPIVTPFLEGAESFTVTVIVTATDAEGMTVSDECLFDAVTVYCEADADCDDDQFCNGVETCAEDGLCQTETAPCQELTESDNTYCDEDSDTCVGCEVVSECD